MTRPRTDQSVLFKLPSPSMEADLREQNPWWKGQRVAGLPQFRRTACSFFSLPFSPSSLVV